MNLLTNPIYWIFIILCLIIIIVCKLYGSRIIGWFGELWTKQELKKLPKNIYTVINNIWFSMNGNTHQIDHIVISVYGIFVIETKQYNGYITGSKYDEKWVRHIGKRKIYYMSPIRQNYGHIKALSNLLNIDEKNIYNIVCFSSNAKLKIKHDGELVRNTNIKEKILSYKTRVIDNVDDITRIIKSNGKRGRKIRKEHINNIKKLR